MGIEVDGMEEKVSVSVYDAVKNSLTTAKAEGNSLAVYACAHLLAQLDARRAKSGHELSDNESFEVIQETKRDIAFLLEELGNSGANLMSGEVVRLRIEEALCDTLLPRQLSFDEVYEYIESLEYHEKYLNRGMIVQKAKPFLQGHADPNVVREAAGKFIEEHGTYFYDESKDPKAEQKRRRAERKAKKHNSRGHKHDKKTLPKTPPFVVE